MAKRLRVGNLPAQVGDAELMELFGVHGVVCNAWVVLEAEGDLASAGTFVRVQGWGHHEPVQLVSQES